MTPQAGTGRPRRLIGDDTPASLAARGVNALSRLPPLFRCDGCDLPLKGLELDDARGRVAGGLLCQRCRTKPTEEPHA